MWGTPNHLLQIEYRVSWDQSLTQQGYLGRDFERHQVRVSGLPDIDNNVVGGWGFPHIFHQWVGGKVLHRLHYKVRVQGHEKKLLG